MDWTVYIITSQVVLMICFALVSAYKDAQVNFVDHGPRFLLRCAVGLLLTFFYWQSAFLLAAVFYALFDYSYNFFRGNGMFYIGATAEWDKFRRKYWKDKIVRNDIILKLVLLIVGIVFLHVLVIFRWITQIFE